MTVDFGYLERVLAKRDGVRVSFGDAARIEHKFGFNPSVGAGAPETVWRTGGIENLQITNSIITIQSTDGGDDQEIVIIGHTLSVDGFTRVSQNVTLNGTTPVTLPTPLARVQRGYNNSPLPFAGTVTVESVTDTHLTIDPTVQQSQKCAFTVPSDSYLAVTLMTFGLTGSSTDDVIISLQVREFGGPWRERFSLGISGNGTSQAVIPISPPAYFNPGSDIRIDADADAGGTPVSATISGGYALILGDAT